MFDNFLREGDVEKLLELIQQTHFVSTWFNMFQIITSHVFDDEKTSRLVKACYRKLADVSSVLEEGSYNRMAFYSLIAVPKAIRMHKELTVKVLFDLGVRYVNQKVLVDAMTTSKSTLVHRLFASRFEDYFSTREAVLVMASRTGSPDVFNMYLQRMIKKSPDLVLSTFGMAEIVKSDKIEMVRSIISKTTTRFDSWSYGKEESLSPRMLEVIGRFEKRKRVRVSDD